MSFSLFPRNFESIRSENFLRKIVENSRKFHLLNVRFDFSLETPQAKFDFGEFVNSHSGLASLQPICTEGTSASYFTLKFLWVFFLFVMPVFLLFFVLFLILMLLLL